MGFIDGMAGLLAPDSLGLERVRERQSRDWEVARRSLTRASAAVVGDPDDVQQAIAHALIGLLAMQMSEL